MSADQKSISIGIDKTDNRDIIDLRDIEEFHGTHEFKEFQGINETKENKETTNTKENESNQSVLCGDIEKSKMNGQSTENITKMAKKSTENNTKRKRQTKTINPATLVTDRKKRGLTNRILLIDRSLKTYRQETSLSFKVMGTTDKLYQVKYTHNNGWKCACPDYTKRLLPCKHIYFVIARVLEKDLGDQTKYVGLHAFSSEENEKEFGKAEDLNTKLESRWAGQVVTIQNPQNPQTKETNSTCSLQIDKKAQEKEFGPNAVKQQAYLGEPCSICYEDFDTSSLTYFCYLTCGKSVHQECFQRYVKVSGKYSCPNCRSELKPTGMPNPSKRMKRN